MLRAMTTRPNATHRDVLTALDEAVARAAVETMELPHLVYVFDRETGSPSAIGPFRSPVEACIHAERVVREIVGAVGCASSLRIDVVPLESAGARFANRNCQPSRRRTLHRWLRRLWLRRRRREGGWDGTDRHDLVSYQREMRG